MPLKSSLLFKVLLNRFHPNAGQSFLKGLPQDEVKEILDQQTSSQNTSAAISWPTSLFDQTHYSWLVPSIQAMPKNLQPLVVACLPESQATKLKKILKFEKIPSLTSVIKKFFQHQLFKKWAPADAIPKEYIVETSLSPLLKLTKPDLINVIDFLALHDLTYAIRHTVDKKNLKILYECLTPQKLQFLRILLHKKEEIVTTKIDIEKCRNNPEEFNLILHKRGMLRFGKALCGENPQFIWHLIHTLDTGRGTVIANYYQKDPIKGVTPVLAQQILTIIDFLKPKSDK